MGRSIRGGRCIQTIIYTPLASQLRFHDSKARFKGYSGPIGSGKSQAMCQEAIRLCYENTGCTGLIGAPTYPMLRDATQASLLAILNENDVPYELNKAESTIVLKDTNARILLRSLDEYERLRGTNLAWFGVDELTYCKEAAWLRLEGRLRDPNAPRLCGFAVWTPKGHDWVYRRFLNTASDAYELVIARPFENHHLLESIPDYYERLRSTYDERFFQQEVLGEYLNVNADRVYHGFDRGKNIADVEVRPQYPLLWALDFNVDPMCSVVAQTDGFAVHVIDEIVISRASTYDACAEFNRRYPAHRAGIVVYGDASGNAQQTTGRTDYDLVREFFQHTDYRSVDYRIPRSNPSVRDRVLLTNAKLRNAAGQIHLTVHSRCKELIRDFEEVSYKAGSTVIDKERDPRRTHLSDALGYLLWQESRLQQTIGEKGHRLF